MHYGPSNLRPTEEGEDHLRLLSAQQLRARLLFHCYVEEEDASDFFEDDYCDYYADELRP